MRAEPPRSTNPADVKQVRVKGWYDRQYLAEIDPSTNRPVRSELDGSIVPDPALADYGVPDFESGWKIVATIHLSADHPKYAAMYGLRMGTNRLELRIDTATRTWEGRILDAANNATPVRVVQAHMHAEPLAVARWGWFEDDELMWVRCIYGCCEVGPLI